MARKPGLTLEDVRKSDKFAQKERAFKVSDLLNEDEVVELRKANKKEKKKLFDPVDALVAEIIARFGYDFYLEWNAGNIDDEWVSRLISAERARSEREAFGLKAIVYSMVSACVKVEKGQRKPKGPAQANKIIKNCIKIIKGEV